MEVGELCKEMVTCLGQKVRDLSFSTTDLACAVHACTNTWTCIVTK